MKNIQEKIKSVIGYAIALILTLIVSSIIYLGCNESDGAIINSLSLIGNYVGAITTLTAAYIASFLFNDWRVQHNKSILSPLAQDVVRTVIDSKVESRFIGSSIKNFNKVKFNEGKVNNDLINRITKIEKIIEISINKMEYFHALLDNNAEDEKDFLASMALFYKSANDISKLRTIMSNEMITSVEQLQLLANAHIDNCDKFNKVLKKYIIAND